MAEREPPATDWAALWQRGQQGWPSRFVLVQFPNAPLLVCFAAGALARIAGGRAHDLAWAVGRVALVVWAYEELARGVNWFRRGLGAAVLVAIAIGLARHPG